MDRPIEAAFCGKPFFVAVLLGAAVLMGCRGEVVPVSGRVTLDGKPLANAVVTFQPLGKGKLQKTSTTGSVGKTDSQGRFVLRLVSPSRRGAAVGDHIVTIGVSAGGTGQAPNSAELLPQAWRDGTRQFRVPPSGTREANFDIQADPSAKDNPVKNIPGKKRRGG